MASYPPFDKFYVVSYAANDRDHPVIGIKKDPRVAGYRVPEDLSPHPDSKRYPNHVFTGAQPSAGDQIVTHIYEILPAPWVPFTRYDDDLGPVQGRRRAVKNEGQQADLAADKKVSYEGRDGSAIVLNEIEETWSIKTDEDGNSLFPIRDRDFYDASRGPVQERRQLFVPTGEEEGSLENINGVITQTSYEPYNEFLSVKIVQTYKVDGPQLIGKATNEEGQLVTITTQRKAALGYVPPNPTSTKIVEVSREDAESLVERIVDTPEVFRARIYRKTKEDLTPQKFRASQEDLTFEQTIAGTADPNIILLSGEFAKSEQQVTKFVKRVSTTSRAITKAVTLVESVLTPDGQVGTRTLTLDSDPQEFVPSALLIDASIENLGDGRTVKTETVVPQVFSAKTIQKTKLDNVPEKFKVLKPEIITEETVEGTITEPSLGNEDLSKSEQQVNKFLKRVRTIKRDNSTTGTIEGKIFTTELGGGYARVIETYPFGGGETSSPAFGTIDEQIENLGDGKKYSRKTILDTPLPRLSGQDYDQELDIVIPYKQFFAEANTDSATGERKRVTPRDLKHSQVVEYDVAEAQEALDNYYWEIPDMVSISLPNKLISVVAVIQRSTGESEGTGFGDTYFYTTSNSNSSRGKVIYNIEEGFNGNIPAIKAVFFLPKESSSPENVLAVVQAKSAVDGFFPNARPQSHELVVFGSSEDVSESKSVSFTSGSDSSSKSASFSIDSTTIPSTIHERLTVGSNIDDLNPDNNNSPQGSSISAAVRPNILEATNPFPVFPTGNFLYQINSTPYRFSYVRVEAIIVKITEEYV
jgi:hypothetical protein